MGRKSTIKNGDIFGKLKVIDILPSIGSGHHSKILCECECGNTKIIHSNILKKKIRSCGCSKNNYENLLGKQYGKVEVISLSYESKIKNRIDRYYLCKCSVCGNTYNFNNYTIKRKGFLGCRCSNNTSSKKYIYSNYKRNAIKSNRRFELKLDEFVKLCESDCYYCGSKPNTLIDKKDLNGSWRYNGLDRVNNSDGYVLENVVTCCKTCNMMKKDMSLEDFLTKIKSISEHFGSIKLEII